MMPARFALAVLLLAWPLQPLDDAVRTFVQSHRSDSWQRPMEVVSGKSRAVLVVGAAAAVVSGTAGRAFAAEAAVALVPVNLAVEALKWTVNRERPDGDRHRANSSFPSSHAANAFTVAAVLARRYRWRGGIPGWALAALVAYSRMYLDRHWFSDVLGALVLALAAAPLAAWLLERWRTRKAAQAS